MLTIETFSRLKSKNSQNSSRGMAHISSQQNSRETSKSLIGKPKSNRNVQFSYTRKESDRSITSSVIIENFYEFFFIQIYLIDYSKWPNITKTKRNTMIIQISKFQTQYQLLCLTLKI